MKDDLICDGVAKAARVERYVAGILPESELEGFEIHLLTCQLCQDEVFQAVAIREGLRELEASSSAPDSAVGEAPAPIRFRFGGVPAKVWIPLAAAAALVGIVVFGPEQVPSALSELGQVTQPPVYLGVSVRREPASAESLFAAAMLRYIADDFKGAAGGLEEALEAGADPVPAQFFLGSSLLMLDRPREADEAFGFAIQAGESPYLPEAHYYRAKALLRLGKVGPALADLRAAADFPGEMSRPAQALADSIEARMGG
ncbi:MAG: hypothetical protein ABIF09_13660 [Gemmatimonadota bacterium]